MAQPQGEEEVEVLVAEEVSDQAKAITVEEMIDLRPQHPLTAAANKEEAVAEADKAAEATKTANETTDPEVSITTTSTSSEGRKNVHNLRALHRN